MLTTTNCFLPRLTGVAGPLLAPMVFFLIGCGGAKEDLPTTYEVTGTVLGADGQPLAGGLVEFRSTQGKSLSATGRIQSDGTFSLTTLAGEGKLGGAVAGRHQVTVIPDPPDTGGIQAFAEPIMLPDSFEVKTAGANQFTVKLPPTP